MPCTHSLPNVGNEGHTYLWHVTRRWDELPDLLLLLPDTVEYGDKLKTWRRLQRRLEAHGPTIYYADDFSPITGFRFAINWLNERFCTPLPSRLPPRLASPTRRRRQLPVRGPPARRH